MTPKKIPTRGEGLEAAGATAQLVDDATAHRELGEMGPTWETEWAGLASEEQGIKRSLE